MKKIAQITHTCIAVLCVSATASCLQAQDVQMVNLNGHKMRVQIVGMHHVERRQPVVVFEGGGSSSLETWSKVIPDVAEFAPVVAYDRAGIGKSEPDGQRPTLRHVAENLHALLGKIGAKPTYVLVGHSLGGPFIRMFAGLYPDEVAGLVYVDPTEWHSEKDQLALYRAMGISGEELRRHKEKLRQMAARAIAQMPPGSRAEHEVYLELYYDTHFADLHSLPPVPEVPVSVLMHAEFDPAQYPPGVYHCEPRECHARYVPWRMAWLSALALEKSDGTFAVATNSGHDLPSEDPNLVVWAIRRIFSAARRPQKAV